MFFRFGDKFYKIKSIGQNVTDGHQNDVNQIYCLVFAIQNYFLTVYVIGTNCPKYLVLKKKIKKFNGST